MSVCAKEKLTDCENVLTALCHRLDKTDICPDGVVKLSMAVSHFPDKEIFGNSVLVGYYAASGVPTFRDNPFQMKPTRCTLLLCPSSGRLTVSVRQLYFSLCMGGCLVCRPDSWLHLKQIIQGCTVNKT